MVLVHIHLCQTMPLFLENSLRRLVQADLPPHPFTGPVILSYALLMLMMMMMVMVPLRM